MFERWLSPDVFQKGVRLHLSQHAFGSATADDFLSALSSAAQRDVKTPFHTFLDQPGVPFLEAALKCDAGVTPTLHLTQSRFLPVGSKGDASRTWQVPVCARYEAAGASHESCTLLTSKEGDLPLADAKSCPACSATRTPRAISAKPAGQPGGARKVEHLEAQRVKRSRMATASARDFTTARRRFATRCCRPRRSPRMRTPRSRASRPVLSEWRAIGSTPTRSGARPSTRTRESSTRGRTHVSAGRQRRGTTTAIDLRKMVIWSMTSAHDPAARREAKRRALAYIGYQKDGAIHRDAVDPDLAPHALDVAGQDADLPLFDALVAGSRRRKTKRFAALIPLGGVLGGRPSGFDEGARAVARFTIATGRDDVADLRAARRARDA